MSFTLTPLEAEPAFDLELFMATSQETRINSETMERISGFWEQWRPHTRAVKIAAEDRTYLLAWLESQVEEAVDDTWEDAPSEAFFINALAQIMVMGLVHSLVPEAEDMGCAPAPRPTPILAAALAKAGVPYTEPNQPSLSRRYAVLTYFPLKGGCELCALVGGCPKAAGSGPQSIVLPGYE